MGLSDKIIAVGQMQKFIDCHIKDEITPQEYSRETPAINYFIHYPIEAYFILKDGRESMPKEKVSKTVTVSVVERPARKLIFLRTSGRGYFEDCEEVGCDWEGYYNSIPEKYDTATGGRLPKSLIKPGTNGTAFFVLDGSNQKMLRI